MHTRRSQSAVSKTSTMSGALVATLLFGALGVSACAARPQLATQAEPAERAESDARASDAEARMSVLQFDNQATVSVDVYLVSAQLQWRLGRVPPGFRGTLRVPESEIPPALGLVQLAAIPGSRVSAEAWRDPRAIIAAPQPISELFSQRWTYREVAGTALQLQATRLRYP